MNLISEDYLMHHGVKGMKWGVRHDPESTKSSDSKKQKKRLKNAAIIGGSIVAAGLMVYGGYKVNNIINQKNLKTAAMVGESFGSKFGREFSGTVTGMGTTFGMRANSQAVGKNTAMRAGGEMISKVSEDIYNRNKGLKKISLLKYGHQISKGKKTPFDVADYNSTVRNILQREDVLGKGQSALAKNVRDTLHSGGHLPGGLNYKNVNFASIPKTQIGKIKVSTINSWEDLAKKNKELFAKSLNR